MMTSRIDCVRQILHSIEELVPKIERDADQVIADSAEQRAKFVFGRAKYCLKMIQNEENGCHTEKEIHFRKQLEALEQRTQAVMDKLLPLCKDLPPCML